jgi:ParB-like chromosome segregation protein Spo0J
MAEPQTAMVEERRVEVSELSESHAGLRVLDGGSVRAMRESLLHHGQLMPLAAYRAEKALEVVDGFKRLRGARELGWTALRVHVLAVDAAVAKAAVSVLNQGHGLCGLEEAWVVRALYREEGLTQPEIGRLLGRDKSWVCRRLLLAEGLDPGVQVDVRLGLLGARTAETLARLPRVNQLKTAERVMRRGLTYHQTECLVKALMSRPAEQREAALDEEIGGEPELDGAAGDRRRPRERTPAQEIAADVAMLGRVCGRLQARLLDRPLVALGEPAAGLVSEGLAGLLPVLCALHKTVERVREDLHASMDHTRRA